MVKKDLCKTDKKVYAKGGQGLVFLTDEGCIIKSIPVENDSEKYWLKRLNKTVGGRYRELFSLPHLIKRCGKYNYYLFDKMDGDLNLLIPEISKTQQKNVLLQCLIAIYIMNHKLKINHNDLFYKRRIINVMYVELDEPYYIGHGVEAKKYLVKIIDFGHANSGALEFRNKDYKISDIDSEPLIFINFFFKTIFGSHIGLEDELAKHYTNDMDLIEYIKKDFNRLYKKCQEQDGQH